MPFERRPWTEWERLPPEEDRSFRVRVENRTGGGEISVGPGGPENPDIERPRFTVGADAPPLAGELVATAGTDAMLFVLAAGLGVMGGFTVWQMAESGGAVAPA
jgi:hypothetical protein